MKICVVSHSLIVPRQYWFFDYVAKQPDVELMQIYPSRWGFHHRGGGYDVYNAPQGGIKEASGLDAPNMVEYIFLQQAIADIEKFNPDIIYVQNEFYCKVTSQMFRVSRRLGCKFAVFIWENISPYHPLQSPLVQKTDVIVCGNGEAEKLVKPLNRNTLRCIQVGVHTDLFRPWQGEPQYDIIFQGRLAPEKGVEVLRKAVNGTGWKVLWPEPNFGTNYEELHTRYCNARVHASPSLDTKEWREQHSGYANLEALSCGLYAATSNSSCIVEGLQGCPGVFFHQQGHSENLKADLMTLLNKGATNWDGREWVAEHYGYEAIAKKLLDAFRRLL